MITTATNACDLFPTTEFRIEFQNTHVDEEGCRTMSPRYWREMWSDELVIMGFLSAEIAEIFIRTHHALKHMKNLKIVLADVTEQ